MSDPIATHLAIDTWRAVIDAMPEAAVALNGSSNIVHHNARMRELFPNVRDMQPLSQLSRNPDLIATVERAWTTKHAQVVDIQERVPVERSIRATVSKLEATIQTFDHPNILVTFRDLSEQDKMVQMRTDFIANASHELRTPLSSLKGYIETLQGAARDDEEARDRFLDIMWTQATRMTHLIDDLLSLSRVEMRTHLVPQGDVDLNEVANSVVQSLEPVAKSSHIEIALTKSSQSARIVGDHVEIEQAIQNLVQNAIKYGRHNGRVDVTVSLQASSDPSNARWTVSVRDDGQGIAMQHVPRLTERFYRVNSETGHQIGGTGLGLAIVKHVVLRHRGELKIDSTLGKGSTFTLVFEVR